MLCASIVAGISGAMPIKKSIALLLNKNQQQ
jgi:hypothetical protein